MRTGEFFLYIAVGLAISLFILSMFYSHDFGAILQDKLSARDGSSRQEHLGLLRHGSKHAGSDIANADVAQVTTTTASKVTAAIIEVKPAVIQSVIEQKKFPTMKGIASSADFQALMEQAASQPNPVPIQRKKPTPEEKEEEKRKRQQKRKEQALQKQREEQEESARRERESLKAAKKQNAEEADDPEEDAATSNAEMSCQTSFEPVCKIYPYIRFWNQRFYPEDCYESPLRPVKKHNTPLAEQKYVVFEPDRGGWNNIRMAAETAIIFAHASGRTLVLPHAARWYLLDKSKNDTDNVSSFAKFFDLKKLKESMNMITTEDFLEKVAKIPGFMKKPLLPNEDVNRYLARPQRLWDYYEASCYTEEWEPGKQFIGFNLTRAEPPQSPFGTFDTNPHTNKRYKTMVAHGRRLRPYNEQLHAQPVVYFPGDYRNTHRILTHFYSYIYWEDPHVERIYRRIVRDRLHYHDSIFCAASVIVHALHADASHLTGKPIQSIKKAHKLTLGGNTNEDATYHAMHIRRGDFQYKDTKLSAQEIIDNTFHLLDPNVTTLLYIATDETDKAFFEPFTKGPFTVKFLKNYLNEDQMKQVVSDFSMNHVGMIEQVICANAHTFIGTPFSTFTGYITRMRGYYRDGRYERTFYTMEAMEKQLQKQRPLVGPFWAREFETAHKDIDDYV